MEDIERMIENDSIVLAEWNADNSIYENGIWSKKYNAALIAKSDIQAYSEADKSADKVTIGENKVLYVDKTDRKEWLHITDYNDTEGWLYFKNLYPEIQIEVNDEEYKTLLDSFICCVQGGYDAGISECLSVNGISFIESILEGDKYKIIWFDNYLELMYYIDNNREEITDNILEVIKEYADAHKDIKFEQDSVPREPRFFMFICRDNKKIENINWIISDEKMYAFAEESGDEEDLIIQIGIAGNMVLVDDIVFAAEQK